MEDQWSGGEVLTALGLAAVSYLIAAVFLFAGPLKPVLVALIIAIGGYGWLWWFLLILSGLTGALITRRLPVDRVLRPAVVITGTLIVATTIGGLMATTIRRVIIHQFDPDRVQTASFLYSAHAAGKEFLHVPHALAIKDCVPYIWSWRGFAFEPLPDSAIANVLPREWLADWRATCAPGAGNSGGSG